MKRNAPKLQASAISITLLLSAIGVAVSFPVDKFSIAVLLALYVTSSWNIFAYFLNKSMWPRRFKELDVDGNMAYRRITFWLTLVFYFVVLWGIAVQTK